MPPRRRDYYGALGERYSVACGEDPGFEAERRTVRQQAAVAAAESADATLEAARAAGQLCLVRSGESLTQLLTAPALALLEALRHQDWYVVGPRGTVVALSQSDAGGYVAAVGDRDGLRLVAPELPAESLGHCFAPDGSRVLLCAGTEVHEVEVGSGRGQRIYRAEAPVLAAQWVAGYVAVQLADRLELLVADGAPGASGSPRALRAARRIRTAPAERAIAVRGGRVLFVLARHARYPAAVLGFGAGGAVRLLGRFEKRLASAWETDARVFAKDADNYQSYYELRFLAEALEAALGEPEAEIDLAGDACAARCRALVLEDAGL
jgi:hypothetical protein